MKKVLLSFKNEVENKRIKAITTSIKKYLGDNIELHTSCGYQNCKFYSLEDCKIKFSLNEYDLSQFDLIYMYHIGSRNYDLSSLIAQFCTYNNIKFINTRERYNYHSGKILQKAILHLNNIPTPNFFFTNNLQTTDYDEIKSLLGGTFVLKQSKSNLGKKVLLIESKKDFIDKMNLIYKNSDYDDGLWFAEEYIQHKNTYRGIVCGDKCDTQIFVNKELDTFKTNHGEAVFSRNVLNEIKNLSVKSAELLKLQIAGVDIVFDERTKSFKVFEVNKSPGITINNNYESFEAEDIAKYINFLLK